MTAVQPPSRCSGVILPLVKHQVLATAAEGGDVCARAGVAVSNITEQPTALKTPWLIPNLRASVMIAPTPIHGAGPPIASMLCRFKAGIGSSPRQELCSQ